jgi:hypothetical protein
VSIHQVHEYSDNEREELEYETEIEDMESSPTYGRENELDENNGYDQDLEEDFGFTSMSDEEIEVSYYLPVEFTLNSYLYLNNMNVQ